MIVVENGDLRLPGLFTAHSHAFQRALRGRTQQPAGGPGSFWSWRAAMYRLAEQMDPGRIYHISRFAFTELALSGVTGVGEFHYLHHDVGGAPYERGTAMADSVIRAALDAGLRITLIRAIYRRAGHGQAPDPAQRRFIDPSLDSALADVETLQARYAANPRVRIAIAAHSVRAVPPEELRAIGAYAQENGLMLHMHVAEQPREVAECEAETGHRPVALLQELGLLDENFVAVHATHLAEEEIRLLGQARATVCLCRTTERDLGDGLPYTRSLHEAGVRFCVGVDSHTAPDAFEELRAVERDERSRVQARHAALDPAALLAAGTHHGAAACGWETPPDDVVRLDGDDPGLAGAAQPLLVDAVIDGATPRAVRQVTVAGRPIVVDGRHASQEEALAGFRRVVGEIDWG